jgi:hypothetical protein
MRRFIMIVVCLTAAVCPAESADDKTAPLQGVWFGTGSAQRIVLVIRDQKMMFIHPTGPAESSFRLTADNGIEIDRFDGKRQIGVYRSDESTLLMALANPGDHMRPASVRVTKSGKAGHGTTMFTRKVTPEGLQTLQVILTNNPELNLMGIKSEPAAKTANE